MTTLTLLAPVAQLDPAGAPALLEKPLNVVMGAVKFADGSPLTGTHAGKAGVFVYRTLAPNTAEEIWNDAEQHWQAPPSKLTALPPVPFNFKLGQPAPWQALLVAVGQKDAAGAERFVKATAGYPCYRARAYLEAVRGESTHSGTSAPSADWTFASEADQARFALDLFGATAKTASRARLQIKSPSLVPAGFVEVRAEGGNEVEIARCDGGGNVLASILIGGDGEIRIRPAAGKRCIIEGDLKCGKIHYQPFAGGAKQDL